MAPRALHLVADMPRTPAASTTPTYPDMLVATLLGVTASSQHSYEIAVHRLLLDLQEALAENGLSEGEYALIIGAGIDVLFFFNYGQEQLLREPNIWYRASVIHQIGWGMLQTLEKIRPDLAARPFFHEAMDVLAINRLRTRTTPSPLHCRDWLTPLAARTPVE